MPLVRTESEQILRIKERRIEMSNFVKFTQNGNVAYFNTDHIAIITPHPNLVNQTNVTLATGLNAQVDGSASDIALKLGYVPAIDLETQK